MISISPPREFSFELSRDFLSRSPRELLHQISEKSVSKALDFGAGAFVVSLTYNKERLRIDASRPLSKEEATKVKEYIRTWFDLRTDLTPFYTLAKKDKLLAPLVKQFYGYRIIGQPDLFESLVWAVLGQQINLAFAYTLKQRFVEAFGQKITCNNIDYYLFPKPNTVAALQSDQLLALQFSRQKAAYTIGIAREFLAGNVNADDIRKLPLREAKEALMKIKGIGNWTANYALMKTFQFPDSFPLEDAGLHNAIKNQLNLKAKPSLDHVRRIFKKYKGWEAYATLYLWKSL